MFFRRLVLKLAILLAVFGGAGAFLLFGAGQTVPLIIAAVLFLVGIYVAFFCRISAASRSARADESEQAKPSIDLQREGPTETIDSQEDFPPVAVENVPTTTTNDKLEVPSHDEVREEGYTP